MSTTYSNSPNAAPSRSLWSLLNIQLTKEPELHARKIKKRDLTFVLRNLATLVENGLPLPKALATLARERTLKKYTAIFETIRRKIESGETFSNALSHFPRAFNKLMVQQIRVGERSGTLATTIDRVASQVEKASNLKAQVLKKLAYPIILVCAGGLAVTFMLLFVIPVFQKTYSEAKVPLPAITQVLIDLSSFLKSYALILLGLAVSGLVATIKLRKKPDFAYRMDRLILQLPILGAWFRDLAVLQFMDVLGILLDSGYTVVEALGNSIEAISNCAVKRSVSDLRDAVTRGERFSRELDRQGNLFPPVVSQLVIVGEKTGNLAKSTAFIREHLRREIERTTSIMVGTIEPVLTISMACMIGVILLAIYLPMFDMIGAMNGGAH
ncbi:MAG TPA: type II secretion system F family protein [Pirellulales bacterium]|jgi:type IV pilus assembly protein PilC|nr:type II secretion system F family protein [Pirellulales bacterium]